MGSHSDVPDAVSFHEALAAEQRTLETAGRLPHGSEAESAQAEDHVLLLNFISRFKDVDESPALALKRVLDRVESGEDGHRPV